MNSCSRNQKQIAELMLDGAAYRESPSLLEHLAHCDNCRRFADDLSLVQLNLKSMEPPSGIETTEKFHQDLVARIRLEKASFSRPIFSGLLGTIKSWRLIGFGAGALALFFFLLNVIPEPEKPQKIPVPLVSTPIQKDLSRSVYHYQQVANQSLDGLDALLTQQGISGSSLAFAETAAALSRHGSEE
jgi:hypothetical protein